ncbi:MAG: 1-phosphofructokinase family hexose kinase [Opitutales bacterium]
MPKAVTLTMNPSLDLSAVAGAVREEEKVRCSAFREDPGGGGVNVARALHRLGREPQAVFPSGGVYGQRLQELLAAEGVRAVAVAIAESTRVNPLVREREGTQYRFTLPGPELSPDEREQCLQQVDACLEAGDILVASGSLPPGVPDDFYRTVTERAHGRGAVVVLDAKGQLLREALAAGPDWIKPNRRELQELLDDTAGDEAALFNGARQLFRDSAVRHLLLSLGSEGVFYCGEGGEARITNPPVKVKSLSGAGDTAVAGLIHGLIEGKDPAAAARVAVAAGAAAVLTPGTELLRPEDFQELLKKMEGEAS